MALPKRTKKSQTKINVLISVVFHVVMIGGLLYLAARQGVLGNKMKQITAFRVKEEKPPEPPKPKTEPKPDEPKPVVAEAPKTAAPPPVAQPNQAPPPVSVSAAPPPAIGADFSFSDGAKVVQSSTDPIQAFKGYVEYSLRSRWNKPEGIDDTAFAVEVEVALASDGRIENFDWKSGSNDKAWDASVRAALAATKSLGRPLPKGFPPRVIVRFDAVAETETLQ
jgi:type IV secretory pathway VirB10-like protein